MDTSNSTLNIEGEDTSNSASHTKEEGDGKF